MKESLKMKEGFIQHIVCLECGGTQNSIFYKKSYSFIAIAYKL